MPATLIYNPILHAPATARTQLAPTRGHARYAEICPMNPLTGIWTSHRTALGYRYASPNGERQPVPAQALSNRSSVPTQFLSDWHSIPTTPPPFRHTPCRFWPRQATPVWRNLPQNSRQILQRPTPVWRNLLLHPHSFLPRHAAPVWRNTPANYSLLTAN